MVNFPTDSLSSKEFQVLELLYQGLSNRQIGSKLHISERTVKFHCAKIYRKFNVKNRMELLLKTMNSQ